MGTGAGDAQGCHAGRIETIWERFLEGDGGRRRRLAVVEVGGTWCSRTRAGLWGVPAAVWGGAVQALEGGVVARFC